MREELLKTIEKNSKLKVTDLATVLALSEEEVKAELLTLEKEKIICGYHTLVNWDKTTVEKVTALIEVKVTPQRGRGFDKLAERIYGFEEVNSTYLMSGGYDFTVIIEGKTMKEVALFVAHKLAPIEGVLSTATHFVLKKYKEHGIAFEAGSEDKRMAVSL